MELLLSKELMRYAKELELEYYEEFLPPEEREEARRTQSFKIDVTHLIILCQEKLVLNDEGVPDSFVEQHREIVERWLDEHYSFIQLENISGLIRRTLQLSTLTAKDTPSAQTNLYISEASRAYIHGFQNASVAMSRAALEQAVKERLGRQGDGEENMLGSLLKDAKKWKILSKTGAECAWDLKEKTNKVLHESPVKDEEAALEILVGVRSLLEEIYTADGRF
jgi:hypothetical protein